MNPWIILAAVLAIAGAFVGGEYDGRNTGHADERTVWQAKDNKELATANAKILQLETDARAKEAIKAENQHLISLSYQKDLQNDETRRQKDVADARSGAISLRDPGAPTVQTCGGGSSEATASAGGRDGQAGGGLSPEATEFLLTEADRADAIVSQLGACQAVIDADRAP